MSSFLKAAMPALSFSFSIELIETTKIYLARKVSLAVTEKVLQMHKICHILQQYTNTYRIYTDIQNSCQVEITHVH